jgi:hypothetical protein
VAHPRGLEPLYFAVRGKRHQLVALLSILALIDRFEDSDLLRPTAINRGGGQLTVPAPHGPSPLTRRSHFVLMAHKGERRRLKRSEAETTALLEAEVDEAIATYGRDVRAALRATLIANTYLETEIERLTEAISTGFARGRMRNAPQRVNKI